MYCDFLECYDSLFANSLVSFKKQCQVKKKAIKDCSVKAFQSKLLSKFMVKKTLIPKSGPKDSSDDSSCEEKGSGKINYSINALTLDEVQDIPLEEPEPLIEETSFDLAKL